MAADKVKGLRRIGFVPIIAAIAPFNSSIVETSYARDFAGLKVIDFLVGAK